MATMTKSEPIPYDEVEPGYYWAQFTGPLEIVQVRERPRYSMADLVGGGRHAVYLCGSMYPRFMFEFRFWQRIEAPDVPL